MKGSRHKARVRALEVLYESEVRGSPVPDVVERRRQQTTPPINEFTARLAAGVDEHRVGIDELIARYSVDWSLERMPVVDRNILRIGVFELLWDAEVPDGVAVAEAVALARELSSDAAPNFVNGLLSRVLEHKETLPR